MRKGTNLLVLILLSFIPALGHAQTVQPATSDDNRSLGDIARERRAAHKVEIKVTQDDSKKLFSSISETLDFASDDTGFPKRSEVKHQLIGQEDVKRHMSEAMSESAAAQRLARSELVLKKFGFLPRDFDLKTFLVGASGQSIAGYYDFKTKTMCLLNWIALDQQMPIMAHELTHALQDQNYDLQNWHHHDKQSQSRQAEMKLHVDAQDDQEDGARTAVVEGQAMVVFVDYTLKPINRRLAGSPDLMQVLKGRLDGSYDTAVVVHNAPFMLKESSIFPYREGLNFELELLKKGGTRMAFAGAFARPPRDTHEILQPEAYLEHEKQTPVIIPDLRAVLPPEFQPYDSGTMGELDVRIFAKQFGRDNDVYVLGQNWRGGSYIAVKRSPADPPNTKASTADLGLLYVSRWKTTESAERFIQLYKTSLSKRTTVQSEKTFEPTSCAGSGQDCGPRQSLRVNTDEGPVFIELWPGNLVFIAHTFDEQTVSRLRQTVLKPTSTPAPSSTAELSLRLYELPAFRAFQQELWREVVEKLNQER
ncbi:MAG TPA: hypothetical protein VEG30_19055 [Terriglobales bacterium]|nr:hypothetical protein [Terriglobales bacterium]